MQSELSDRSTRPACPEPFALIVGKALAGAAPDEAEAAFRRMGLRPERVEPAGDAGALVKGPLLRLRFGEVALLGGRAAAAPLERADPDHPATSRLAASLPPDWSDAGQAWAFFEEPRAADGRTRSTPLREIFKMQAPLIDLLDASHYFWSPARLWSEAEQFRAAVTEMLTSGMPPVLQLIAFRLADSGAGAAVRTRGLALFGGQELEGRMPAGWTAAEMVKRLSRLALDIMLHGPVTDARRMRGLNPGEWVSLSQGRGRKDGGVTVMVEFGSSF